MSDHYEVGTAKHALLTVLVRDLGYTVESPPLYGRHPLRHQHAWHLATEGVDPDHLKDTVDKHVRWHQEETAVHD